MGKQKPKKRKYSYHTSTDTHHLCFQRKHWQQGYAQAIRENWYLKVDIPRDTVHRELHSKIHDIPVPNGAVCRAVYERLIFMEECNYLHASDRPSKRLKWLSQQFSELDHEHTKATVAMLEWQAEYFAKRGY